MQQVGMELRKTKGNTFYIPLFSVPGSVFIAFPKAMENLIHSSILLSARLHLIAAAHVAHANLRTEILFLKFPDYDHT